MAQALSRRGLFEAFRPDRHAGAGSDARVAQGTPDVSHLVARFQPSCVERQGVTCRRCGEACEPQAIRFRLVVGGRAEPLLNADLCTGCAECLAVCPVSAISLVPVERTTLISEIAGMMREPHEGGSR